MHESFPDQTSLVGSFFFRIWGIGSVVEDYSILIQLKRELGKYC